MRSLPFLAVSLERMERSSPRLV
ncbi:MAG: hypothetical protein ACD_13C00072G0001, partial [uncultured bacterium]